MFRFNEELDLRRTEIAGGEEDKVTTKQQHEALDYFRKEASNWKASAVSKAADEVNVIQQRNDYVLEVAERREQTRTALDVGCGTGDLVCALARRGVKSTGIDFASEMIDIARENARREELTEAGFHCSSIFDFDMSGSSYDLISANGFIEYISYEELDRFFDVAHQALDPQGSFVVGSRNRLFNIFSLNDFTTHEIDEGAALQLLKESVRLASTGSIDELLEVEEAPLQRPQMEHTPTGIDVSTRYQFTPVQLMRRLEAKGFEIVQVYPIHIHAVAPTFQKQHGDVHATVSNLLQTYADEQMSLVPFSSSFMLHVVKP